MTDFATARRMMVDGQVRPYDITDQGVLAAMLAVPRETFMPPELAGIAYIDTDVPVGKGRRLLKPMVLAKLLQAAMVGEGSKVLVVGCATGYDAAVLAHMGAQVTALEEDGALAAQARRALAQAGSAVSVVEGPLTAGWSSDAPYDAILVSGCAEVMPPALFDQLKDDGRLVAVMGEEPACHGMIFRKTDGVTSGRSFFDAAATLLPGFAKPKAFAF